MTIAAVVVSAVCLALGVLAYGAAGARLHTGSQSDEGALRSKDWWLGTGLQGAGFLFTLLARRSLPMLIVQSCSSLGLAVTALIQHLAGTHRMDRRAATWLTAVILGVGLIAVSTVPGHAVAIRPVHLWLLAACLVVCGAGIVARQPVVSGALSGLGFAYAAVGARLLMGDAVHPLWRFWELPLASWLVGLLTASGIVLGQVHLTRGLSGSTAPTVLAPMYLLETLFPMVVGIAVLAELPRPGTWWLMLAGLVLALAGTFGLTRRN